MKNKKTIAAMVLAALTTIPAHAKQSMRGLEPSINAKRVKTNNKLANKLIGQYGLVRLGAQTTLNVTDAVCVKKLCIFSYELDYDTYSFGFTIGRRAFFTESFIEGHVLYSAQLPPRGKSANTTYAAYQDRDCAVDGYYSFCERGYGQAVIDQGAIHAR